jgi:dihydroflavonol-4-reductase
MGASGFLGSHVTRQLIADGAEVRAMVRPTANTIGIDDLPVKMFLGDIFDANTLQEAMAGCDVVYYCVVDTRGWLRDTAPLFRTNVEGLRNVLDVAKNANLRRFVYTSSYATVGRCRGHRATEDDLIDIRRVTAYVRSRVQGELSVLRYAREHGLPAVAMCVSTTYGSGDWGRTPHGAIIAGAAFGRLPFVMNGIQLEAVGVDDAARALILAAERGRVGERYLISEKMISNADVARIAAEAAGVPPPVKAIPLPVTYVLATVGSIKARPARHRRTALARLAAADACRGGSGSQQGDPRTRLATAAGRGVDPRGGTILGRAAKRQAQAAGRFDERGEVFDLALRRIRRGVTGFAAPAAVIGADREVATLPGRNSSTGEPKQLHRVGVEDLRRMRGRGVGDVVDSPDERVAVLVGKVGAQ